MISFLKGLLTSHAETAKTQHDPQSFWGPKKNWLVVSHPDGCHPLPNEQSKRSNTARIWMIRMQLGWAWAAGGGCVCVCCHNKTTWLIIAGWLNLPPTWEDQTMQCKKRWCVTRRRLRYFHGGILTPRDRPYPPNNKPLEIPSQWLENDRLLFGASVLKVAKYNRLHGFLETGDFVDGFWESVTLRLFALHTLLKTLSIRDLP